MIGLADRANSRLSFSNLTEAHVLDALRRQYQVELPQIRRAVSYLREHFRSSHPLVHHEMPTDGKSGQLEELDVEGILAFAERILPRAADLWVQASLDQCQRFQQLFFPDGIAFRRKSLCSNRRNCSGLQLLAGIDTGNEGLVDQNSASWNRVTRWLRTIEMLSWTTR